MTTVIHIENKYEILDEQHICCGESQFTYRCLKCLETMGCYYCEFDCYNEHDCDILEI